MERNGAHSNMSPHRQKRQKASELPYTMWHALSPRCSHEFRPKAGTNLWLYSSDPDRLLRTSRPLIMDCTMELVKQQYDCSPELAVCVH